MIAQKTIEECKQVSLVQAVEKLGTPLKQKGGRWWGCCPFLDEKSPSFTVSKSNGYKCFGCGKGGSGAISFYMDRKNLTYPEAIEAVASDFGIAVIIDDSKENKKHIERESRKKTLANINENALRVWQDRALPEGVLRHECEDFEIGYAPDEWDTLKKGLKDVVTGQLFNLGLLSCKEETNHFYDRFLNRLMFPIRDYNGLLVGFGGQSLEATDAERKKVGKYINSKETELYKKENVLYGLHLAKGEIRKAGYAYLVEGYWGTIAMHHAQLKHTVGSCGTSLTEGQIKLLAKYTDHVVLVYDGDKAGIAAAEKAAKLIIENGLQCSVVIIPDGKDPDDLVQEHTKAKTLDVFRDEMEFGNRHDGIEWLAERTYKPNANVHQRAAQLQSIAELVAMVENPIVRDEYAAIIKKKFKLSGNQFQNLVNNQSRTNQRKDPENTFTNHYESDGNYSMPKRVDWKWSKVEEEVKKYGYFIYKNEIWMVISAGNADSGEARYAFRERSNFGINILMHMPHERAAKYLIKCKNKFGVEKVFETSTDDLVAEATFKKMLGRYGNFHWKGKGEDFDRLGARLKDEMHSGVMVQVLGWQKDGFWAMNNMVIRKDGTTVVPDQSGVFAVDGKSYYIPSGNEIYAENEEMYVMQKQMVFRKPKVSIREFYTRMVNVYGGHAYTAILFGIASAFSDIAFREIGAFPILFLFGPPGTGKDQIIHCTQGLFGDQQKALELTGEANTAKGVMRNLAQFRNQPMHWSEFVNGKGLENRMKGIFDRKGYTRATMDGSANTDEVPVISTVICTGNDYPTNDAMLDRSIVEEMVNNKFTQEEINDFDILKDILKGGVSGFMVDIMQLRPMFESDFKHELRKSMKDMNVALAHLNLGSRMTKHAALLSATYRITSRLISLPFSHDEMVKHIDECFSRQMNKRSTASAVTRFWECFLISIRDKNNPLRVNFDFKVEGDLLKMQWSSCFQTYQRVHRSQYNEMGRSKPEMGDALKDMDYFIESNKDERFSGKRSSSWVFNHAMMNKKDEAESFTNDLLAAIEIYELNQHPGRKPTQTLDDVVADGKKKKERLPF